MKHLLLTLTRGVVWILMALLLLIVWYLSPLVLEQLQDGPSELLSRRSDIGQSFGAVSALFSALTLFGLILTTYMQRSELASQREQLDLQRQEMIESRRMLHRSAEATLRSLHMELLKLSMTDRRLAAVWPRTRGLRRRRQREQQFANLIVAHHEMLYELEMVDDNRTRAVFEYLFTSPTMRWFWSRARSARARVAGGAETRLRRFHEIVDGVYERMPADHMSRSTRGCG